MYSLILDSSTKILYIALISDNKILYEEYVEGRNDHAKNIVFKVNEALNTAGINAKDLNEVICGIGPGSYTGVRMSVTVCKMLAVFMNITLYKISTLKLMASGYKGRVLSLIDARRGNVFGAIIDTNNDKYIIEEKLHIKAELLDNSYDYSVDESAYKVDPLYCIKNKELVNEPHLLVPNYLRDTEAERNLND